MIFLLEWLPPWQDTPGWAWLSEFCKPLFVVLGIWDSLFALPSAVPHMGASLPLPMLCHVLPLS